MRFFKYWSLPLLSAVIATTGCESDGAKKAANPAASAPPPALTVAEPVPTPVTAPVATPTPDPIDTLIAAAEKEFRAGQANYAAGHLAAAKDNFDRAFNVLVSSELDLHSDDRLENEFDKIVESVHNLELQALKEGDGFTEQRSEPAPIDEANEVTFPVDPNIKAMAMAEVQQTRSDLPLMMNDQIASFISYFSTRARGTLANGMIRSGRYRDMILRVMKEEGVPQDLIYMAQAESGFHPLALSRAGARGMWQFMASRASGYGLERNWWVDERQDPEKATRAAARHLKDLYEMFGDWYLAMAAYNSGPGTVQRAVQRTGYADFWELYRRNVLPRETRNYVPIIIAITIMSKNPTQYGLDAIQMESPVEVDTVTIDYPVDLRLVSEIVDSSVDKLRELNPSLLRMTTPRGQAFTLRLPLGAKDKFEHTIASIPMDMRVWWRYHKVHPGDTLATIARRYRTTVEAIADANTLEDDTLPLQAKLIIPVAPGRRIEGSIEGPGSSYSKRPTYYRVRKGDTLLSIADDFSVPPEKLKRWNRLKGNTLKRGRRLVIYRPVVSLDQEPESASASSSATGVSKKQAKRAPELEGSPSEDARRHTVRRGDTLSSIASRYKTTVAALKKNNPKSTRLRPGDVIVIRK